MFDSFFLLHFYVKRDKIVSGFSVWKDVFYEIVGC